MQVKQLHFQHMIEPILGPPTRKLTSPELLLSMGKDWLPNRLLDLHCTVVPH